MADASATPPGAGELRERFAGPASLTVGIEEEVMLLDPETLDLTPAAPVVLGALEGHPRFKLELPASQLEVVTPPLRSVPEAVRFLGEARRAVSAAAHGTARIASAGVHPFATPEGVLNDGERNEAFAREYAAVARRQLVCGLHVHVAVGGPERSLAVYNALRSHLPELAALAANGPFHEGRDSGLDSMRPVISGQLPRQGIPPVIESWEHFAEMLRWGAAGSFPARQWWWEARLHPRHGTVEVRVPDAQTTLEDTAAVAAAVHALIARLAAAHDEGAPPAAEPAWKLATNRWSACRHGTRGEMADLETGALEPTRVRLERLLGGLEEHAERVSCLAELRSARRLIEVNGAARQRAAAADDGIRAMTARMADLYAPPAVSLQERDG